MRYGSEVVALPQTGVGTAIGGVALASSTGMLDIVWAFLLVSIIISICATAIVVGQRYTSPWVRNGQE